MKTRQKLIRALALLLLLGLTTVTSEAITSQLKNYDIWRDLPSKTLLKMGGRFYDMIQPDSALVCYNIVANRYYTNKSSNERDLKMMATAMNQLGILYTYYFIDYEKAHRNLLQAKKIAQDNHFTSLQSSICNNLGNIYLIDSSTTGNGSPNRCTIEMYRQAFETALGANLPEKVITAAINMAYIADDSVALSVLGNDIKQFLNYPIPDSLRQYAYAKDYCLAVLEQDKGNLETALAYYDKTLKQVNHKNARTAEIIKGGITNAIIRLHIKMHQDQKALDLINDFIDQSKKDNNHHTLFVYYLALSEYYHNVKKDSVTGDRYELMASREKDITLNQNKLLDAEKAEFLFQIDEINADVQELTARQRMTKTIAWTVASFTLIVLVLLYLLWRRYRQVQENHRQLYENNLALLAVDDERRKLLLDYAAKLDVEPVKYQSHQMEEGEQSDLLHRILYVMETSDEIYDNDFSLERLAQLVEARSSKYVSQVLNEHYHQSFTSVVNDYRIREACRRINDPEQCGQLTVEGIAQSVGFKSYPNFVKNFKMFTGLTPSAYRKQHNAQSHAGGTGFI